MTNRTHQSLAPLHVVKVRLNDAELQSLRVAAALAAKRPSEFLRQTCLDTCKAMIGQHLSGLDSQK